MYYAINGRIEHNGRPRDLPTFFLDEDIQGIVGEDHAVEVARDIIDPFRLYVLNPRGLDRADMATEKLFLFAVKI